MCRETERSDTSLSLRKRCIPCRFKGVGGWVVLGGGCFDLLIDSVVSFEFWKRLSANTTIRLWGLHMRVLGVRVSDSVGNSCDLGTGVDGAIG